MSLSGQKTVTTAGSQAPLVSSSQVCNQPVAIKALATNTGLVYVGDLNVSSSNGFVLDAGEVIVFDFVGDLVNLYVDSAVNGEGVSWLILNA